MAIRETITLNNKEYKRTLKESGRATDKFTDKQKKNYKKTGKAAKKSGKKTSSSFKKVGKSAKKWIAGVAIGAIVLLGEAFRRVGQQQIKFNQKMNESLAIQGKVTLSQRNRMEAAAKSISSELNIASDKVAQGFFFLASAGLDVEQQIANLPVVADFAKAGMFDMATATDIATDAQSALGLTVDDSAQNMKNLKRVTDVLVNANIDANASVVQFGESLTNKAAAALKSANKPLEEGIGLLAAFADQGTKGRKAGEFLARIMRVMGQAAVENTEEFKRLNLIDTEGNFNTLANIVEILTGELEGLSDTQKTARFEQLGFTAEIQDAIKPILGASDAMRDYTESAYAAGGASKEVAENQMKSLQERSGKLWNSFKNTFGSTTQGLMESVIGLIEDMSVGLGRLFDKNLSGSEKMLKVLKDIGADAGVIADLELKVARGQAEKIKKNLQDQIGEFIVPVGMKLPDYKGGATSRRPELLGVSSKSVGLESARGKLEEFIGIVERLPKRIIDAESRGTIAGDARARSLRQQANAYSDGITQIRQYIILQEQLKAIEDELAKSTGEATEEIKNKNQEQKKSTGGSGGGGSNSIDDAVKAYEDYLAIQNQLGQAALPVLAKDQLSEVISLTKEIDDALQEMGSSDIIQTNIDHAVAGVERYNQKLTDLNNLRDSGKISQEQYEVELAKSSEVYLKNLQDIYKTIEGQLGPKQKELFEDLFSNFKEGTKQTDEFKTNLDDIADMVDSIVNLGDAFGDIGENAKDSLRGISSVLRGVQSIKELTGEGGISELLSTTSGALSAVMPAIGIAAGIASMLGGLFGGGDEQTETQRAELVSSLKSLERAVRRNTEAFFEEDIIGGGISDEDKQRGQTLIDEIEFGRNLPLDPREGRVTDRNRDRLEELGELFPEIFGEALEKYNILIEQGDYQGAREFLAGVEDRFDEAAESVGGYGDSLEGAIREFNDSIKFGGVSVSDAMDVFVDNIMALDSDIPTDLFNELKGLDLSTEEGQKRLDEIVKTLFEGRDDFRGDMTPDEFSNFLDFLENQSDGASASSDYARSTQVANSITEIQANEIVFFLERIEAWTRSLAANFGDQMAISVTQSGGSMPSFSIPIPLPVRIVDGLDSPDGAPIGDIGGPYEERANLSIGPFNIEGGTLDGSDIDGITREINKKMKQEVRGSQF